jgi:hypothetical protein
MTAIITLRIRAAPLGYFAAELPWPIDPPR